MFTYKLRILIIDVTAEGSIKLNEAAFVAEITESVHDLFQPFFLGDLILQHLLYQHRVLRIGGIPKPVDTLYDILYLLNRVRMRNARFTRLLAMDAPAIILWNEYRMLQEHMEDLQDNNWCGHPVINRFNTAYEDEAPEWHEEIRKSLTDISYSLLRYKKENEPIPEE